MANLIRRNHNRNKHKIKLVAGQYLRMYLFFITLTWGLTLSRLTHLVHYPLLIWSHIGTKGVSLHLKTIFFSMGPSKANTVGIVKNSPSLRTTRKTLQFFRALDCKTVGIFLKISKEIGKTCYKSLTRAKRASLTHPWGV